MGFFHTHFDNQLKHNSYCSRHFDYYQLMTRTGQLLLAGDHVTLALWCIHTVGQGRINLWKQSAVTGDLTDLE